MRIDFGLVLAIVLEYIFFIYYADTLCYKKKNKYLCYAIIAFMYIVHFIVCMFGNVVINALTTFLANFFGLILCYHITLKNSIFQAAILLALCAASEYLIIFIPYIGIAPYEPGTMSPSQSLILTLISRTLYLIELMIASRLFYNNRSKQTFPSIGLFSIPIITIVILMLIIKTNITSNLLAVSSLLLVIINVIIFIINQKMVIKELEISTLKEQELKERIDFEEYNLLKEEIERMNMIRHDYKALINGLSVVIDPDNKEARQYIEQFYDMVNAASLTEYSDSKMLNILLSRMKTECDSKGIKFSVDPIQAHMSFIKDMDIVVIFSNLIKNAVDSCEISKEKNIFLNISTVNDSFIVIKVENSCDEKPFVSDGKLLTRKGNSKLHGIGMSSINKVIKSYGGHMSWEHNMDENVFTTTIIIVNKDIRAV